MARSRQGPSRLRRASKPKPTFRGQVPADVVDQLLYRFVALVKHGLELMLRAPSGLARDEFDQHPEWVYAPTDIPSLVAWTAQGAYDLAWPAFCQHVLGHPDWQALLGVQTQADLDALAAGFERVRMRCIELAIHDALKEGDKRDTRPADQRPAVQDEFAQFIGASQALKLLKKRLRPLLEQLDAQDPPRPPHRPRDYRTRSFLLADVLRWLVHLDSTDELIRKLQQHPPLAGAVNLEPGHIPSKATFSRRRMAIPLEDLQAILHELVHVLTQMKVLDGRAWVLDLTRLPTHSSVSKEYPDSPNGKSDPDAAFCGYADNDGGLQFGYSLLFIIDFKTELPFAVLFTGGSAQDSPCIKPLLDQACTQHPDLAERCQFALGDGGYDTLAFFEYILNRLHALPAATKNPRNAADPHADLATDAFCVLRRPSPWHKALFRSRTAVERTNSRIKFLVNLKYHKNRGWNAVQHCALFATIAMLGAAWVAVETGHPDKLRSARTWISLN